MPMTPEEKRKDPYQYIEETKLYGSKWYEVYAIAEFEDANNGSPIALFDCLPNAIDYIKSHIIVED